MGGAATIFRAAKIYRSDGALLGDGAVLCRGGRIEAVARWAELAPRAEEAGVVDLGDVLLLPGLVNAHTHLRLTHLKGAIARRGDFVRWLGAVALRSRLSRRETLRRAIRTGERELLDGGVTTAVEIDVGGLSTETLRDSPMRLVFAHECIGLDPRTAARTAADLVEQVARFSEEPLRRLHGLAPHAPYSVSAELWEELARILKKQPRFLTIHLDESAEEVEMFTRGTGKMVTWLRRFRVLPRGWRPPRCSPGRFLAQTGILSIPGIAAHCGRADDGDIALLARFEWTVAFCPGTHEYFARPPYPLEKFRDAGVPVCIATDSAASNTGLSMMEEMRRVARDFPSLSPREIVAMATSVPARAIGWGEEVGTIEPGFCADFSAWTPAPEGDRLERSWFEAGPPRCLATIIEGRIVRRPDARREKS